VLTGFGAAWVPPPPAGQPKPGMPGYRFPSATSSAPYPVATPLPAATSPVFRGNAIFPGLRSASNTTVRGSALLNMPRQSGSLLPTWLAHLPTAVVPQVPVPVSSVVPADYPALPGVGQTGVMSSGGGGGGGGVDPLEAGIVPTAAVAGLWGKFNALSAPIKIAIVAGLAGATYFGWKHFKKVQVG
jgi:hypothetical protein